MVDEWTERMRRAIVFTVIAAEIPSALELQGRVCGDGDWPCSLTSAANPSAVELRMGCLRRGCRAHACCPHVKVERDRGTRLRVAKDEGLRHLEKGVPRHSARLSRSRCMTLAYVSHGAWRSHTPRLAWRSHASLTVGTARWDASLMAPGDDGEPAGPGRRSAAWRGGSLKARGRRLGTTVSVSRETCDEGHQGAREGEGVEEDGHRRRDVKLAI